MAVTVHTVSGTDVAGADLSTTDEVKTAKETLAKHLSVVPSQLMLLHGGTVLNDTMVLDDVRENDTSELCLTVVIIPQLIGIFSFKTYCAFDSLRPVGSNTSASIVAVFKDGIADIVVNEHEITSSVCLCHDDKDPYGDYGAWLARYVGVFHYMDHDDFSIDVTLCQRRGIYNHEQAPPSVIQGKWCAHEKDISLESFFAAGGCNDYVCSASGKTWITLQQRDELPAEYARNVQEVAEVWAPKLRTGGGDGEVRCTGEPKSKYCVIT